MLKRKLRGFQLRVSVLSMVQNGKLGVGKARRWKSSEFDQTTLEKTPGFQLGVFGLGYSVKRKTQSGKPRKTDSPSFRVFDLTG